MKTTGERLQYANEAFKRSAMRNKTPETSKRAKGRRPITTIVTIHLILGSKVMPQMTMTRGKRSRLIRSAVLQAF